MTGIFQKSVERSVEAQKKVLDFASAQSKTAFEATKKQLAPAGAPVAAVVDSFQRGTEAFIETQRQLSKSRRSLSSPLLGSNVS